VTGVFAQKREIPRMLSGRFRTAKDGNSNECAASDGRLGGRDERMMKSKKAELVENGKRM